MDEILIEEKRYVSSKQAAKVTGYAKDYIGQLCREGRVPARLVGRSWYVLESAIHDHRFGNPKNEPVEVEAKKPVQQPTSPASTWESPRYEASEPELLPPINSSREEESLGRSNDSAVAERLQETWQAWFDRFDDTAGETPTMDVVAPQKLEIAEEEIKEPDMEPNEEVNIPIHAVQESHYQPAPKEFLPHHTKTDIEVPGDELPVQEERRRGKGFVKTVQIAGAVVAMVVICLAVLGSGYMDSYIISNGQVGLLAGVGLYNK